MRKAADIVLPNDGPARLMQPARSKTVTHYNTHPKPFIWTNSARDILQEVTGINGRSSSNRNEALHCVPRLFT